MLRTLFLCWVLPPLCFAAAKPTSETRHLGQIAGPQRPEVNQSCALKLQTAKKSNGPNRPHPTNLPRKRTAGSATKAGGPCNPSDFSSLQGAALAEAAATADPSCLDTLWTFDATVAIVLGEPNLTAIKDALLHESNRPLLDAGRAENLLYFLQIAFFHEFYEDSLNYSDPLRAGIQAAVVALGRHGDFMQETPALDELRRQWSVSIDSVDGTHLVVDRVFALLQRYRDHAALAGKYVERSIVFNLFFSLGRQIYANGWDGDQSPWYNALSPENLTLLRAFAVDTNYNQDTEFQVNNAIYVLGNCSVLNAGTAATAHRYISDAYNLQTRLSPPWLRAVVDITEFFDGKLYDGIPLDLDAIRTEVSGLALPHEYVFDEGRLIFKTAISKENAEQLYDAMQEVESQFFRKCTYLDPTPGDENDILTLVIYGSPADYQAYQPFLYDLNTNNGGIYIENWGTLFTYDRTPEESYLTLEELLRHEYVHYLDGRYLVVPSFGQGPMYQGERLTWYAEGLAEFLAGSTRTNGVLPRGIYLDQIDRDGMRMSIAELMVITYSSGFRFYQYAGMYFTYLDHQRPDLLAQLLDSVRADNPTQVDSLYAQMAGDADLQNAYDQWLDGQIAQWLSGAGHFAEDFPTDRTPPDLPGNNQSQIQSALEGSLPGRLDSFHVWEGRYQQSASLTIGSAGLTEDQVRDRFETAMDQILVQLQPQGSNFGNAVSWFGNLAYLNGQVTARYVVEGPYRGGDGPIPPAAPSGLSLTAEAGGFTLRWQAVEDAQGYQVYRSSGDGPTILLASLDAGQTSFEDGETEPCAHYGYALKTVGQGGLISAFSATVSGDTTCPPQGPPAQPTGLTATALPGAILLQWHANSEADLAGYQIHKYSPGIGWTDLPGTITDTIYRDTQVSPGSWYYYLIRAVNLAGERSPYSDYAWDKAIPGGGILLVNGSSDGSHPFSDAFASALNSLGYSHDMHILAQDGEIEDFSAYLGGLVIWSTGYYNASAGNQLSARQRGAIRQFLDQGGNLVFSSAYASLYLDQTALFRDYFHVRHVSHGLNVPGIVPVEGGTLSTPYWLSLDADWYQSEVAITPPAVAAYAFDPWYGENSGDGIAIFTVDQNYKLTFFSFPFKHLATHAREELLGQILTQTSWKRPAKSSPR